MNANGPVVGLVAGSLPRTGGVSADGVVFAPSMLAQVLIYL